MLAVCVRAHAESSSLPLARSSCAAWQASIITSVRALPTRTWSEARSLGADDNEECSLCMERFEAETEVRTLQCKHYFHTVHV